MNIKEKLGELEELIKHRMDFIRDEKVEADLFVAMSNVLLALQKYEN